MAYHEARAILHDKSDVDFEHPAQGEDHCGECVHFIPRRKACELVKGLIESEDWCKLFKEKE